MKNKLIQILLISVIVLFTKSVFATQYTFSDVSVPNVTATIPMSINENGNVVGFFAGGLGVVQGAFTYFNGAYRTYSDLSGLLPQVYQNGNPFFAGVNNSNQIVGSYLSSYVPAGLTAIATWQPFVFDGTNFTTYSVPGASQAWAYGINNSGQIVGAGSDNNGNYFGYVRQPDGSFNNFALPPNSYGVYGISDTGVIAGYTGTFSNALINQNGTYTSIPFTLGGTSLFYDVNSAGDAVGGTGDNRGFVYKNSMFELLTMPDGTVVNSATGISNNGSIVGSYTYQGLLHGFLAIPIAASPSPLPKTTTWEGQSPIDFNTGNVISAPNNAAIQYHYSAQAVTLKNTADAAIGRQWGSLVATSANANSYVTVGGDKYVLTQFHFHTASEHTVNGVHNPMEMHLVHLKVHDNGKPYCYGEPGSLLVISALINDGGSKKNAELDKIFGLPSLASLADGATYSGAISPINIQKVLPSNGAAYRYHGSLTEPTNVSCDASVYANTNYNSTAVEQLADHRLGNDGSFPEAVSWVVLSTPIALSTAQITLFKTLFPTGGNTPNGNSRPTQNLDHTQPAIVRNTDRKVQLIK